MNRQEEVFRQFNLNLQEEVITRKTDEIIGKWEENNTPEVLKFLYSCIDFSSLNTDDSKESIWKLVEKINDFEGSRSDLKNVAAICVYPRFIATVKEALRADVRIVSVAGGFPSSQTFTEIKIAEVALAVADGADEIDIVMNCGDFLDNNFQELCGEIDEIKEACHGAVLKVIIETGLLLSSENIKKASILSMYSGADFIKTSTGKMYPGASAKSVYVIAQAIKEYNHLHKRKVGIKVSGGIKTIEDALKYYTIVKEILGKDWMNPAYFRIGASSLANNILDVLQINE
jgi:deoxyribose-phosphate aldolase